MGCRPPERSPRSHCRVGRRCAALYAGARARRGKDRLAHRPARFDWFAITSAKIDSPSCAASKGIANDTTVVFYGDKNNWWACYAFWVFKLYGHEKCLIMNGGRKRWEVDGRAWSRDPEPTYPRDRISRQGTGSFDPRFPATKCSNTARPASRWSMSARRASTPARLLHMPDYPQEGALRGGPHSRRGQHSLVESGDGRRHVQIGQGTGEAVLQGKRLIAPRPNHRLLPHRRAQQPHLVRAQVSAWASTT